MVSIAGPPCIPVVETIIPRELLEIADEVFFTGYGSGSDAHSFGGQSEGRKRTSLAGYREDTEKVFRDCGWFSQR